MKCDRLICWETFQLCRQPAVAIITITEPHNINHIYVCVEHLEQQ